MGQRCQLGAKPWILKEIGMQLVAQPLLGMGLKVNQRHQVPQFTSTAPDVLWLAVSTNTSAPKMRDRAKGRVTSGS